MFYLIDIRERHIRRGMVMFLTLFFLWRNWGSTIDGIEHVILSARTWMLGTVGEELAKALGRSIIPFGQTAAHLTLVVGIWFFVDCILKWADIDSSYIEDEFSRLQRENAKLQQNLSETNEKLYGLNDSLRVLAGHNTSLERHKDRVVELTVELEKLGLKKIQASQIYQEYQENSTTDMFRTEIQSKPPKGKAPPRRFGKIRTPKF